MEGGRKGRALRSGFVNAWGREEAGEEWTRSCTTRAIIVHEKREETNVKSKYNMRHIGHRTLQIDDKTAYRGIQQRQQ